MNDKVGNSVVPSKSWYGTFGLWYGQKTQAWMEDPRFHIGQCVGNWDVFEPSKNQYDFSRLEDHLDLIEPYGLGATVQVNGSKHPSYLFNEVPYIPAQIEGNWEEDKTLIYWDQRYKNRHKALLVAFFEWLSGLPQSKKDRIVGIRQSFNAVGTEAGEIPPEWRNPNTWKGVDPGNTPAWTTAIEDEYRTAVVGYHLDNWQVSGVPLLIRSNFVQGGGLEEDGVGPQLENFLRRGEVGLFVTSGRYKPKSASNSLKYQPFIDWSPYTFCYSEPWQYQADVGTGATREQVLYWRHIMGLAIGQCFIGNRGTDGFELERYYPDSTEDLASYDFANQYAGCLQTPESSPGAWVAFRPTVPEEKWTMKGDYNFLAERLNPDSDNIDLNREEGDGNKLGPTNQRHGLWARRFKVTTDVTIALDSKFTESLADNNEQVRVRVIALGDGGGLSIEGKEFDLKSNGKWGSYYTDPFTLEDDIVTVSCLTECTLHLIEVQRQPANGGTNPDPENPDPDPDPENGCDVPEQEEFVMVQVKLGVKVEDGEIISRVISTRAVTSDQVR